MTLSRAYKIYRDPRFLQITTRAQQYLEKNFIVKNFGGIYWSVDFKGQPIEYKKQIYAQAFANYGLSESYSINSNQKILQYIQVIFQYLEIFAYDDVYKGFYDACYRNWI